MRRTKTIAVAILACSVSSANAQKMYWPDASANKIQRANVDGTGVEDLVTGLLGPVAIALDLGAGKMYWIDYQTIQRADLAGSNVETLITGLGDLLGLALDTRGGKMYWLGEETDKVHRANLDGTGLEDLVDMGTLFDPGEIVLDVCAGKMYWSESASVVAKIQRANMEIPEGELPTSRSDVEDVLTFMDGLEEPWGLAVDGPSQKIYWTDNGTNKIQRANLDGSDIEDLVTTGLDFPRGMTLDLESAKMYWADAGTDKIQRANLDGSNIEDVVATGLASPFDIALDLSEKPCEGDANGDGAVDPLDSGYVLARFGCPVGTGDPSCDAADQNGDGAVDPLDSGFVLARFGPCP